MLFNSISFLVFFPIVTFVYFVIPHRLRWMWLLLASYYFYMSWNPRYALIMGASTVITYLSGILMNRSNQCQDDKKRLFQRKLWVTLSFCLNLAILFFFKYFDFTISTITRIFSYIGVRVVASPLDIVLPVGISFYIFQALSYTMDVYRGAVTPEKNIGKYALFVSFFPLLVAGPIERSKNLLLQIGEKHTFDYRRVKNGLLLMLWGFFQKLVVADRIAVVVNAVYSNYQSYYGFQIILGSILFAVQIYCDFSGYTDIAIGAARIMGFRPTPNFKQPYFATSIQDFWRRWHITLSTWFRDYVFAPLSSKFVKKGWRMRPAYYVSTLIVWLLSGLWHGANWNFIIWGGLHGVYQVIGVMSKSRRGKLYDRLRINIKPWSFKLGQILSTFLLVNFAWIFFRASTTLDALRMIKRMVFDFALAKALDISSYAIGGSSADLCIIGIFILILLLVNFLQTRLEILKRLEEQNFLFRWALYYALIFTVLVFGNFGINQFIYFQF